MGREDECTMIGGGVITSTTPRFAPYDNVVCCANTWSDTPSGGHEVAWDHVNQHAALGAWHHVAMVRLMNPHCAALYLTCFVVVLVQVYDSSDLHFFLDGAQATSTADSGDMVIRPNELVIGKAGPGLGTSDQPINECNSPAIFARAADSDRVGLTCNCAAGRFPWDDRRCAAVGEGPDHL